jgi:ribosomal protein L37E
VTVLGKHAAHHPRCLACGEFLTAATDRCPACGAPLDETTRVESWHALQTQRTQIARARVICLGAGAVALLAGAVRSGIVGRDALATGLLLAGLMLVAVTALAARWPVPALEAGTAVLAVTSFLLYLLVLGAGGSNVPTFLAAVFVPLPLAGITIAVGIAAHGARSGAGAR